MERDLMGFRRTPRPPSVRQQLDAVSRAAASMPAWALTAHLTVAGIPTADAVEAARRVVGWHLTDAPSLESLTAMMREAMTEAHAIVDSREA